MKGIRARRKAERPVEILEAAFQEFVAKGFAATRLEDVAKRVGITKGTIYFYFGSKSAVFERCVRMVAENSAAQFAATAAEWTDDFEADVRGYLARIYRFLDNTPQAAETMRLLVAEASRLPHLVDAYFEHLMDPILENLRKRIALAVAVGEIPEPPRFLPEMVLSPPMAYLVVKLLFDDRRDYDSQTIFEVAFASFAEWSDTDAEQVQEPAGSVRGVTLNSGPTLSPVAIAAGTRRAGHRQGSGTGSHGVHLEAETLTSIIGSTGGKGVEHDQQA